MKQRVNTPVWLWINLLSLDAPLVAILWQDFLARCYPSLLRPAGRLVLGLTVWAIYLADRLIDVRKPAAASETPRHRFYRENRALAKILLAAVLLVDLLTTLLWLRPAVLLNGLLTAAAVLVYLAVFVLFQGGSRWKQLSAAILFTAGVFLIAWTGIPAAGRVLSWAAVAFCALCLGNISLIENWEHGQLTARGWIWLTPLASICLFWGHSSWYTAIAISAILLAALDLQTQSWPPNARRVLADAVLLTPLLAIRNII